MDTDVYSGILSNKWLDLDFIWCPVCMTRTEHGIENECLFCINCRKRKQQEQEILNQLGYDAERDKHD